MEGPAIIEEREATTVIGPGDRLAIDGAWNLRIAVGAVVRPAALVTAGMAPDEARARIEADPIGLEIMWSRLISIVEEMWQTVRRTAYSLIISESQDFANEILDAGGNPLAHSPRSMPLFNLTLTRCVQALLEHFPPETLHEGDVLVTNDPWLCAGHLFDIALVTPVFRDGRLVALMATVGHVSDIGGVKDPLAAREIYDEGVLIPPMKLYDAGRPDRSLLTMLASNIRNSDQVLGDIQSLITANALGGQRLVAFMDEYGLDDVAALAAVVQGRSEAATRAAIRAVPDGVYESTIENRPLGEVLRYRVRVHKTGERIHVEHLDAPRQLPRGGLNCTMNVTMGHSSYPLKCMLTPNVRGNAGCYLPITITAPAGTALNCDRPAAVAHRTRVSWYLGPNLYKALAPAMPDRVQAFTGLPKAFGFYGRNSQGRVASDHFFMGGGQGASLRQDGKSGLLYPTSAANTPVELLESRMPVLVLEKTLVADSGGPGRRRGGLGQRMRARRLDGGTEPISVGLFVEGWGVTQDGLFGGHPGTVAYAGVRGPEPDGWRDSGAGEMVSLFDDGPRSRRRSPAAPATARRQSARWRRSRRTSRTATSRPRVRPATMAACWRRMVASTRPPPPAAARSWPPVRTGTQRSQRGTNNDEQGQPPPLPAGCRRPGCARRARPLLLRRLRARRQPQDPGLHRQPGGAGARPALALRLVDPDDPAVGL